MLKYILAFFISITFNIFIISQNRFNDLNKLPTTIEIRAPEYNTISRYIFRVDSNTNNLIIQDLRTSNDEKKAHYHQWLYELPLNDINANSFQVSKCVGNETNSFEIIIGTKNDKNSINNYMFHENKVAVIKSQNILHIGDWLYSDSLFNATEKIIKTISSYYSDTISSVNLLKPAINKYKYLAENVTTIGITIDKDISLGEGYYYGRSHNDNKVNKYPRISKKIKEVLKEQNIVIKYPIPVIIYANKDGIIEDLFIGNEPFDKYCQINLYDLKPIKPVRIEGISVPTKLVFLLE